jgi:hypothetical protein
MSDPSLKHWGQAEAETQSVANCQRIVSSTQQRESNGAAFIRSPRRRWRELGAPCREHRQIACVTGIAT